MGHEMRRSIVLGVFCLALHGCVGVGQLVGKPPVIENDNFAIVHIARPGHFGGCGGPTKIQLDRTDFYLLACGDHLTFRIPADRDITISQTSRYVPDQIYIEPKKGKEYYFENDCNSWVCWFTEIEIGYFNDIASKCDNAINIGSDGEITTTVKNKE